ncbi:MAG: RNA polymerase sigma factor [Bacteroidaceae bacterium]|nr:RNA polymerase sigma factor [Bacteroidaceae bacterium]
MSSTSGNTIQLGADQRLIAGNLRRGEVAAQKQFLRQYAPGVFQLVVRIVDNQQDAEELTQDTLLRAIRNIDRYDSAKATLATWVQRIAYRLAINHLRDRRRTAIYLEELPESAIPSDSELSAFFGEDSSYRVEQLVQALDHLPPDEQTLVHLFYYDDLPLRDIAYILEAPPGTIATRLHRIRQKLYHLIQRNPQQ